MRTERTTYKGLTIEIATANNGVCTEWSIYDPNFPDDFLYLADEGEYTPQEALTLAKDWIDLEQR